MQNKHNHTIQSGTQKDGCISLFIQKHNMRYKHFSICIIKTKFLRMENKHNHTIQSGTQKDKLMVQSKKKTSPNNVLARLGH
jgi:hypothetical protein